MSRARPYGGNRKPYQGRGRAQEIHLGDEVGREVRLAREGQARGGSEPRVLEVEVHEVLTN